ncbi:ornithine carbamoyltransferase [Kiritimatiellaeota bacterium B1221]|nr:ornithine carbamoyltransferase [Kiritimatiellaeota bacterium B1221]
MEHLSSLTDWTPEIMTEVLDLAGKLKADPKAFARAAEQKVLFMIFEKPSLRTRVSFETGIVRMGGHAINYDVTTSPLGAGKESLPDTIKVVSRYADLIVARLFKHSDLTEMIAHAGVPVINGLTDYSHPCQIMADLLTIREHKGLLKGKTLCFLGDGYNNVTHSLLFGCAMAGMNVRIGCPGGEDFEPLQDVLDKARELAAPHGGHILVSQDAHEAASGADVVYTDSWMSYHIDPAELDKRVAEFMPYQVTQAIMDRAHKDAIFMNCLPAARGYEQTAEVIDGPQSVVFDQAENRLHAQNAVMLRLLSPCDSLDD